MSARIVLERFPLAVMRIIFAFKALYEKAMPWAKDRVHWGVDLEAYFVPCMAMGDGVIVRASRFDPVGWGHYVTIQHKGGWQTIYAHLSEVHVQEGQFVPAGHVIGITGDSGSADGQPHLHLELRMLGVPDAGPRGQLDPFLYMGAQQPGSPPPLADEPPVPDSGLPVGIEAAPPGMQFTVVAQGLRIRNGPGTGYMEIGQHAVGTELTAQRVYIPEYWIEFKPGQWSAAKHDGNSYLEPIK